MATYTYSYSGDFGSNIKERQLKQEIDNSAIATTLDYITRNDDAVDIVFLASLSAGDVTTLNGLVSAHTPIADPELLLESTGTGATTTTITSAQTANRVITLPDLTDTVVTLTATQTLSNKTAATLLTTGYVQFTDMTAPSNPSNGLGRLYKKTGDDGIFWRPDSAGAEVDLTDSGVTGPVSSLDNELVRFNGTSGNVVEGVGIRHYGKSATNPTSPTPSDGDKYYNTALNHEMFYDGSRSKWLSVAILSARFGSIDKTAAGAYYKCSTGAITSASVGEFVQKGTITQISYTSSLAVNHTFQVTITGGIVASLNSGGAASARNNNVNANFESGVMAARNAQPGSATKNLHGLIQYRLRI